MHGWNVRDSLDLYNLDAWGAGFFTLNDRGHVEVRPRRDGDGIDLLELVQDLERRGLRAPLLIRFSEILSARVHGLADSFQRAMREYSYRGAYRGVYPIKVNQQRHVVEEIIEYGADLHIGLEAGRAAKTAYIVGMAILKIARMGHPVLRAPAAPVGDPTAAEIRALVADMRETLCDAEGVGLAAPQIHVPLRIVIFDVPAERSDEEAVPPTVLINPEIESLTDETALDWEACLSVPGMMGVVPRSTHIRYRGVGLDGGTIEREARGFHARVVQHECDHLDGILYPGRIEDMGLFGFADEIRRAADDEDDDYEDEGDDEAAA